jgi:hypothetical protein
MSNIKRDSASGAVLSTDIVGLNKYKQDRAQYRKVDKLQADVLEIKQSILSICERIEKLENK